MPGLRTIVIGCAAVALLAAAWAFSQERRLQAVAAESVSGELVAYDATHQDLLIHTARGDRHFVVREGTPVHEGASTLVRGDLAAARGCPAKVSYRSAGGASVASDVRISCRRIEPHAAPAS